MQRNYVLFFFLLTCLDAKHLRPPQRLLTQVEALNSMVESAPCDETVEEVRKKLHGERCTICLDDMDHEAADALVGCAHSKYTHGFHAECLKGNIVKRHTKCPLCGEGIDLPVPDSVLRIVYENYLKDLGDTIEKYSNYEFKYVDDLIREPFESDMIELAQKMTFPFGQKKYLLEHFPTELEKIHYAYVYMLRSFERNYKSVYIASWKVIIGDIIDKYRNLELDPFQMKEILRSYASEAVARHSNIQQLWWSNFNVESLGVFIFDTIGSIFDWPVSSNELQRHLSQLCETSAHAITDALLLDYKNIYQEYRSIMTSSRTKCFHWYEFIPEDLREYFFSRTKLGKVCNEAEDKLRELIPKLTKFAQTTKTVRSKASLPEPNFTAPSKE